MMVNDEMNKLSNSASVFDAVYIKRKLIYLTDNNGTDFVTDSKFNTYLQLRTNQPKMCRTFSTQREMLATVNAL
jgi:hypothetical protein